MRKIKIFIKRILDLVSNLFPISNIIIFESDPELADNTYYVFYELLKRHANEKNKLVWVCHSKESTKKLNNFFQGEKNIFCVHIQSYMYKFYYSKKAKAFIVCNLFPKKQKKEQYYCNLAHGCALKNAVGYSLPENCKDSDVMTISNYMAPFDAFNLSHDVNYMRPLGYARNDDLFVNVDLKSVFLDHSFEKMIYWLPTYRQYHGESSVHSDISMPILYSRKEATILNECARKNDVLIVVKVHPSQDLEKIEEYNLSNVLFIKNDYFLDKDFTNYQLLGNSDAMLSDYSSVYYDYLLCDKPIGLCWDDFEEYNKREGFTMNPEFILKGGEKIYNINDLCDFVESVANGEDNLRNERNEIKNLVHDHFDNKSTERIVDYLETKILL